MATSIENNGMSVKERFGKFVPHLAAVLIFLGLVLTFFEPAVFRGKVIVQGDNIKASGMGANRADKYAATAEKGEFSVWSDAMFSGMPYGAGYGNAAPELPSYTVIDNILKAPGYTHAAMVFTGLVCFYIFLCILGVNFWLAIAGAIAFAFASYNIIIIEAGHIVKAYVIAYMPVTLAGMALLFRRKYLWGGVVFLLGIALSLVNGHIQITYYLALLAAAIYLGYTFNIIVKEKKYMDWAKASAIMAVCLVLAVMPNVRNMYSNWDLGQNSIRGKSELSPRPDAAGNVEKASTGLDKTYAFQWSYGWTELLTVMIPNVYGGSSGGLLGESSNLVSELKLHGANVGREVQSYTYWGDKSFTSGPVYFGALVCFLFVLGMFTVRNPIKWWALGGAVFLTFLALGRNFDAFNDFMFHNLPLYNKFRTVEMALVIPGLVFPAIGIWGLWLIISKKTDERLFRRGMNWAYGITGGVCLLIWLVPSVLLDFRSPFDEYNLKDMPDWYVSALIGDRESLASKDAFRSLAFITAGFGLLMLYRRGLLKTKNAATLVSAAIAVLILADLWTVDRRYINDKSYTNERPEQTYKISPADEAILKDASLSYRVLGLNNPWQNTDVSYFHNSIGGYHAVKLRRYQELIDNRLDVEYRSIIAAIQTAQTYDHINSALQLCRSLNMLNMRYIIYDPSQPPLFNSNAYGNCWFVDNIMTVDNADGEIAALNSIDPKKTAVVDRRFAAQLEGLSIRPDSSATIVLEKYRPSKLTYRSSSASEGLAVFSEVYYSPGWKATVDGKAVDHLRADWLLRAIRIPAGEHTIVFEFHPDSYVKAAYVSSVSSFIILILLLCAVAYSIFRRKF